MSKRNNRVTETQARRNLSRYLTAAHQESGLNNTAFAQLLGLSRTYLGELEQAVKTPAFGTLVSLAQRLETTPDVLLGYSAR